MSDRGVVDTGPSRSARALTVLGPALLGVVAARAVVGAPAITLAAPVAVAAIVVLLLRVELAALLFVAVEPFEDYAKALNPASVKALGALLVVSWLIRLAMPQLRALLAGGARPGDAARPRGRAGLRHPVVLWAVALIAVVLAATVLHSNGAIGTEVLGRYLSFLAALIVLVDCLSHRLPVRRVVVVFVSSCTVAAVVGIVNYLGGAVRTGGPLGDPNDFAFFLVAALPLAIGLRHGSTRAWVWDAAAVLIVVATAGTLSRGALAAACAMVLYGVAVHRIRIKTLAVGAIGLGVLLGVGLLTQASSIQNSLHQKDVVAQQNVDERLVRWTTAAEMTASYPVLGLGPAGFRVNYDRWVGGDLNNITRKLDVAHEAYLEVSSELGLLGLAAFLGVLGSGFAGARRRSRLPDADDVLADAVCTATVGVVVAAAFLTEQYFLPLWLLAALGAAIDPRRADRPDVPRYRSIFMTRDADVRREGAR